MAKFNTFLQINDLREIENDTIIELTVKYNNFNSSRIFNFSLSEITFNFDGETVIKDYSKYKISIEYSQKKEPKIFIKEPVIAEDAPHRFSDKSLCLFKTSNFKWTNSSSIAKDIFPLIITWIYFNEIWLITGIWEGKEAKH